MTHVTAIIGWARPAEHADATAYHGVVEVAESVVTACNGRWSAREVTTYIDGRDRDRDDYGRPIEKCGACLRAAQDERTRDGLAELAHAPVERRGHQVECIRDDSTECDCSRCTAAEDAFWAEQEGDTDDRDECFTAEMAEEYFSGREGEGEG